MLTEVESLFLVLAVIYVSDCLWWLPWNSCVVEQWWPGGRWRLRSSSEWAATRARALIALTPWPTGIGLEVSPHPLSLSPVGFVFWSSLAWTTKGRPRQSAESWLWSEVRAVQARGEAVYVNGDAAQLKTSEGEAARLARLLDEVRRAPPSQREDLIIRLRSESSDPDTISERLAEVLDSTSCLRWTGAAQATLLFIVAPVILMRFGGALVMGSIATTLFSTVLVNVVVYLKLHRRAFPKGRWERAENALVMCLCWPVAIRAAAALCRHQLTDFDPLAVLLAIKSLEGRELFVNKVLRDLQFPLGLDELPPRTKSIVEWQLQHDQSHLRQLAAQMGIAVSDENVEKTATASGAAYCPRCLATYSRREGECTDCPGVELHERGTKKGASRWTNPTAG